MAVPNLTPNSPAAGSIAWSAFNLQYGGVTFSIPASNTDKRYVWWVYNNGNPIIYKGDVVPSTLTDDDVVLFANKNGIPINILASSVVEGGLIVDGSIVGTALLAGTIQGDRIKAGTLTADLIATDAVNARHIAIGDFTNYASGSDFEALHPWTLSAGCTVTTLTAYKGTKSLRIDGPTVPGGAGATAATLLTPIKVTEGDKLYLEFHARRETAWNGGVGNSKIRFGNKANGALVGGLSFGAADLPDANTWTKRSIVITIPPGVTDLTATITNDATAGNLYLDNIVIRRMLTGELIVDGAIKSSMIDTVGLDAQVIKFGTMHGDRIAANTLAIGKTAGLQNELDAKASEAYVISRGTDLVANGTGALGDNTNFTDFNANGTDVPTGAVKSFYAKDTVYGPRFSNALIPFSPAKKYKFSFQARQTVAGATGRAYGFLAPYDAQGQSIQPTNYMFQPNTTTTLAQPLNNGDTTIRLTSAANWYGQTGKPAGTSTHFRSVILWDWTDPNGKVWPAHTYSRNGWTTDLWADGSVNAATNTITLRAPWSGGSFAAGHPLSNGSAGGSYMYMPTLTNAVVPEAWTQYGEVFDAGVMPDVTAALGRGGATWGSGMPPGTAQIKVGWLLNAAPSPGNAIVGRHAIAAVSFSDASAAADAARTFADAAQLAAIESKSSNANSTFALWTGSTPNGYSVWNSTVLHVKNTVDAVTGGAAVQWDVSVAQGQAGVAESSSFDPLPVGLKYVTVEMDVMLKSGTFSGAGLLLDWTGITGGNRSSMKLNNIVPAPVLNKWYKVSAVLKRPSDTGTQTAFNGYLMANYPSDGLGALSDKNIIFDRVALRPSTVEEITAYEAPADATAKAALARTDAVADLKTLWGHPTNTTLIDGGDIYTNSIKATSIQLSDWNNYWPDRYFTLNNDTYFSSVVSRYTAAVPPAGGGAILLAGRDHVGGGAAPFVAARPGDEFLVSVTQKQVAGTVPAVPGVWTYKADGSATTVLVPYDNAYRTQIGTTQVLANGWSRSTWKIGIKPGSTDCAFVRLWLLVDQSPTYTHSVAVSDIVFLKRNGAELIVDGTIKAGALGADSVEAINIKANAITAEKIEANAVTANKLNIVMGGGNLWSNSSFEDPTSYFAGWGEYDNPNIATLSKVPGRLSGSAVRLTWAADAARTATGLMGLFRGHPTGFKANARYTLSFYARGTGDAAGKAMGHASNNPPPADPVWNLNPLLSGVWQRYSLTFSRPTDTADSIFFGVPNGKLAGTVEYDDIQLEDGDVTTAYSPQTAEILPGTIQTAMVAAGAIKTEQLFADAVTAAKIKAGEINAGHLQAGSITTEKLTVGSVGDNIILNGNFKDLDAAGNPAGWTPEAAAGAVLSYVVGSDTYMAVNTPAVPVGTVYQTFGNGSISVSPGDQFHVEVGCVAGAVGHVYRVMMHLYSREGVYAGAVESGDLTTGASAASLPSAHRKSAVLAVPPGGTASARFGVRCITANSSFLFDKYTVGKVTVSARIADDAITAAKIKAKAVISDKIDTNAIRAGHVEAGAITADKIHLGAKGFAVNDNSNFEQEATDTVGTLLGRPAGWRLHYDDSPAGSVSLSLEKAAPLSGSQSARISVAANQDSYLCTDNANWMQVNPGEKWFVSARVKAVGGDNVAFDPLRFFFATGVPGQDPFTQFNGSNSTQQQGTNLAISNGEDKIITATFTVPANHRVMGIGLRLPPRTAAGYYLVEDFVAHPAVENTMVTDISAGKLTTGFIQAGQRIIAGASETGARTEMTDSGFFAYNSGGGRTFTVQGSDGTAVIGNPGSINISMSAYTNIWNYGVSQAMINFAYPGTGWSDGQLFSQYWSADGTNWSAIRIASPYVTDMARSAYLDVRSATDGRSQFFLRAAEANFSGNSFIWGSGDTSTIDFRTFGGDGFQFSDYGQTSRLRLVPQIGFFLVRAAVTGGGTQQLRLQGSQVSLSAGGQEAYWGLNGPGGAQAPNLAHFERNIGLTFNNGNLAVSDFGIVNFKPIGASAFNVASDPRVKSNVQVTTGGRDTLRELCVYDYDTEGSLPRKSGNGRTVKKVDPATGEVVEQHQDKPQRARGVMADQVRKVLPDAVHEDEQGRLSVSLYDLLATTMAAVRELDAEVDDLRAQLAATSSTRHKDNASGSKKP